MKRPTLIAATTDPYYWLKAQFKDRTNAREYGVGKHQTPFELRDENDCAKLDQLLTRIVGALETRVRHGITHEDIAEKILAVLGPKNAALLKPVHVGQKKKGTAGLLVIECLHPVYACDLRRFIRPLEAALKDSGITKVSLR